MIKKVTFKNLGDLKDHLKSHLPTFYFSSQTSTVIPYDYLEELFGAEDQDFYLGDLSKLPSEMKLEGEHLFVKGPINWKDAREFLISKGRNIMTAPTEDLALVTAGIATSATGERCFSFGTLRSQIINLKYLNHDGIELTLESDKDFESLEGLKEYQKKYQEYGSFKNAPFPRFEKETDLLTGTEGQLGLITEATIKTVPNYPVTHLFILLPKWEDNYEPHMEVFHKVQNLRKDVIICELLDSNSINYLKEEDRLGNNEDVLFLEIKNDAFEEIYETLINNLEKTPEDKIFEISTAKFQKVRSGVPRAVFEKNAEMSVKKMGTDVQVTPDKFKKLLDYYRKFTKVGVNYNLFGHFGDAHLHFNFMPTKENTELCKKEFEALYKEVKDLKGSPFAEHGIGIIKKPYIKDFYSEEITTLFKILKDKHDPYGQFFPQGFMNFSIS